MGVDNNKHINKNNKIFQIPKHAMKKINHHNKYETK